MRNNAQQEEVEETTTKKMRKETGMFDVRARRICSRSCHHVHATQNIAAMRPRHHGHKRHDGDARMLFAWRLTAYTQSRCLHTGWIRASGFYSYAKASPFG